jgi:lipid A disaccharide synthetase
MVKSPYVSLPNLLAQRLLVPELLQDDATVEALAQTLSPLIDNGAKSRPVASMKFTGPFVWMLPTRRQMPCST